MTTNALTTSGVSAMSAFSPGYIDAVERTANHLAKSGMFAGRSREQLAVIIMQGHELGLGTMQAVNGIYVIAGRAALRAELAVSLVLSSGKAEYFRIEEGSPVSVTAATRRVGTDKEIRVTWTMDDAKRAGINNPNYQKYPQRMLEARAQMALARQVYPDVLMGLYAKEELEDSLPEAEARVEPEEPVVPEARQIPASAPIVEPEPTGYTKAFLKDAFEKFEADFGRPWCSEQRAKFELEHGKVDPGKLFEAMRDESKRLGELRSDEWAVYTQQLGPEMAKSLFATVAEDPAHDITDLTAVQLDRLYKLAWARLLKMDVA